MMLMENSFGKGYLPNNVLVKSRYFQIIRFFFFALLGAGLLYLVFRGIDLKSFGQQLWAANYYWVGASLLITLLGHISRARRWQLLIGATGDQPSLINTFLAMMAGYFVHTGIPRLGEITRCASLAKLEKVKIPSLLGTVVMERAIDVMVMLALLVFTYFLEYQTLNQFFREIIFAPVEGLLAGKLNILLLFGLSGLFLLIAGIVLILFKPEWPKKIPFYLTFKKLITGIWQGFISISRLKQKWAFLGHTGFIWLCYYAAPYTCLKAVAATAESGAMVAFSVFAIGTIGRSIPTPASGMGAYHFIITQLLLVYGIAQEDGLVFATLIHAAQTVFYLGVGGISLAVVSVRGRKKSHFHISTSV